MCTSPITIKNNSRRYRDGVHKMFFNVPCGHCKDCLKQQQDDWFVRSFFEYNRVKKCGGSVFFPTLTYNDYFIPIYFDEEFHYTIPCFSREDIKSFRDKLRVYLSRDWYMYVDDEGHISYHSCSTGLRGDKSRIKFESDKKHYSLYWKGVDFNEVGTIRFIITSEFGSKTGRSHYHGLLFVPFPISVKQMLFFLRKAWIFGFVGVPKKGLEVQSVNAVQYCMKYVSKDQYWLKKYEVSTYISLLKDRIDKGDESAKEKLKQFRACMPNHYQSTGFGFDMVKVLNDDNIINNEVNLSEFGFVTKNKFRFTLPRYIVRKLTTYKDEFGLDVPTTHYKDLFEQIFLQSLQNDFEQLNWLQTYDSFKEHVRPLMLDKELIDSYWNKLHVFSKKRGYLVVYNRVYRDVPVIEGGFNFGQKSLDYFLENALAFAYKQKFGFIGCVPYDEGEQPLQTKPFLFNKKRSTFADFPCFNGFDDACRCVELINESLSALATAAWLDSEEKSRNLYRPKDFELFDSFDIV